MEFKQLNLSNELLAEIERAGFSEPSDIQAKALPLVMQGKDVIGAAATGSGKTLAFGAGIIDKCERGRGIQSLVLTPTRELAEQVAKTLVKFSAFKKLKIAAVYGGVGINPQIDALRSADVVVATPGRMLDHMERRTVNISGVRILVLDEADKMLEMGFVEDVERILRGVPKERQTMLFSATISDEIRSLSHRYMNNPESVSVVMHVDPTKLRQVYYDVPENQKLSLLAHLLKNEKEGLVMVFCNTRRTTDFVAKGLKAAGVDALAIHGGFAQNKRSKALEQFHRGKVAVIICTDVAARGLDIQDVSHVYNYNSPADSKQYVHRIGRTARAGKEGKAVSLVSDRDYENFDAVMRFQRVEILKRELPHFERLVVKRDDSPRGGRSDFQGRGGSRGGGNFRGGPRGGSRGGGRRDSRGPRSSSSRSYDDAPRRPSPGKPLTAEQRKYLRR